uniref:Prolyl endopeptidase n=1 Tax=Rhabditophanes sp. KR3021 TaxID=114890 RepID=A0AC35TUK1_9BILA
MCRLIKDTFFAGDSASNLLFLVMPSCAEICPESYPLIHRDETVKENYHGTIVSDPYRYLENPDAQETKDFVDACNRVSEPFLSTCLNKEQMTTSLRKMWDYEKYGCVSRRGQYYYYSHNSGLQNQSVYYRYLKGTENYEIFIDPNTLSADGTTFIRDRKWCEDGNVVALGISEKGSDWMSVKFLNSDKTFRPDEVKKVKHSDIAWNHNDAGIFYSRYPEGDKDLAATAPDKHEFHSLYYHKMGTNQSEDVLVAEFRDNPNLMVSGHVTHDGRYLIVSVSKGCDPQNMVYYYDLSAANFVVTPNLKLKPLFTKFDAKYDVIYVSGNHALVTTDHSAPMTKIIKVELETADTGSSAWETLVPENASKSLDWAEPAAFDKLFICYVEDVKEHLYVHNLNTGTQLYEIPLEIGTISGLASKIDDTEFFLSFESFFVPTIVYQGNFDDHSTPVKLNKIREVKLNISNHSKFVSKQVFYPSKDGTKIPMFILYNADAKLDGTEPCVLSGYGGFNVSMSIGFSISRMWFLEHFKGVLAIPNLRGGAEYGKAWHEGGMKLKKQNVFDDFIGAAEYLIKEKYTCAKKLAIQGGSNGGLLVAACSYQRPELFGAVVNRVGVMDMIRFPKFSVGAAWIPEYGDPQIKEEFDFLYQYSPLHNIKLHDNEVQWPATILMTADHDDRVVPSHSLKYIAELYHTLQAAKAYQKNPILLSVEVAAGHGAGKPTSKLVDEIVAIYSFVQKTLDIQWHD